ncbi:aminotransferase class I/II-fold pyridoxal phosphate-dependent enzyme [Klebsiella sp. DNRA6]|uniref:aminotransferase class I/II-fold pyridoxal phosphate-dependent enzyme n=1 Tax=Klebsiella sp. DNRA6 TaxID=2723057 RepID=UPI001474F3D4|nr:aminotransferase class I/II-fold pyridoxal phosphate-dependent enzyme [Klebsiella sp. DNRA6]NMD81426.1 aminotransferase class I/II-fold pyridoxal phosphate-dependent enzyme [Klebsiella sp. DNRA6]
MNFVNYFQNEFIDKSEGFFSLAGLVKRKGLLDFGLADAFLRPSQTLIDNVAVNCTNVELQGYVYSNPYYEEKCLNATVRRLDMQFQKKALKSLRVLPVAGAKSGLSLVAHALISPGDIVLVTTPGYPFFMHLAKRLGANVLDLQLTEVNDYLPDLESLDKNIAKRAKLLLINYPNNPTGRVPSQNEIDTIVDFCARNNIILINDAAYIDFCGDNEDVGYLFNNISAYKNCIEIYSLSKSLQIPNWRLGYVLGNVKTIDSLRKIELVLSNGQPKILQDSVLTDLEDGKYIDSIAAIINRRIKILKSILMSSNFKCPAHTGAFFVYVAVPKGIYNGPSFYDASECASYFRNVLNILVIPWTIEGRHYLRFSVAFIDDEKFVFTELEKRLNTIKFLFI